MLEIMSRFQIMSLENTGHNRFMARRWLFPSCPSLSHSMNIAPILKVLTKKEYT